MKLTPQRRRNNQQLCEYNSSRLSQLRQMESVNWKQNRKTLYVENISVNTILPMSNG